MYIAIEGTKGTGKSTLLEALTAKLQQDGVDLQLFAPTKAMPKDIWWEKAYADYSQDDIYLESLYTARANYHASQIDFERSLILGDRSILTSFVTRWPHDQMEKIIPYLNSIRQKERLVPLPDLVIYLDLSLEQTLSRLAQRQRNYGLYDEQEQQLEKAKKAYNTLFSYKNELGLSGLEYEILDANQKPETLMQNIYALVMQRLEKCEHFQ